LEKLKTDSDDFVNEIIQEVFGLINRRENISNLNEIMISLNLKEKTSSRFLINLVLQNSNIELKSRLIYYLS
jgi:hypothetical protein